MYIIVSMTKPTEQPAWEKLSQHQTRIAKASLRDRFQADPLRAETFCMALDGLLLDYSRNLIDNDALQGLLELARNMDLPGKIDALFAGNPINITENRAALHTALRREHSESPVTEERQRLNRFVDTIHNGVRSGYTGKPFRHIVNIGIGGSYLGPLLGTEALKNFAIQPLTFHFLATVDPDQMRDVLAAIDPETTLFIISSKTFTTLETLTNARTAQKWLASKLGLAAVASHFVAVTATPEKALEFGITNDHIFHFWNWVGGRYSIWSAIGLPVLLLIGTQQFTEFLAGAEAMDQHFQHAPLFENMPVLLGLLGIWYINFFHASTQAILPYSYRLRSLPAYIQQLDMESNGKSTDLQGDFIDYQTSPITFGDEGCNSQHSFYQLLHQGKHLTPIDFIIVAHPHATTHHDHHLAVLASALSQSYAFLQGKSLAEAHTELLKQGLKEAEAKQLAPHLVIEGSKPCNLLILDKLTPHHLGMLLALYEHKVFVQSVIWNINPFDQWGVELGKKNLPAILAILTASSPQTFNDPLTLQLILLLQRIKDVA